MKAYTDIEQSKKLAEILSLESADMQYYADAVIKEKNPRVLKTSEVPSKKSMYYIPCWSLTALLSVIPKRIKNYNVLRIDIGDNDFAIWYDEIGYGVNNDLPNITMESSVDACYEMIIKLNEMDLLS